MRAVLLAGLTCAAAVAQTFPEPPPLLRIIRGAVPDPEAAARYAGGPALAVFAATTVTGPAEGWSIEAQASFAALEALEAVERAVRPPGPPQISGGLIPAVQWLGVYRPWLSYRPTEASQMLGHAHYFQVLIFRVNPEAEASFVDAVKARKASLDDMNLDRPEMAYQVISGAPTITYLFVAPLASLKSLDEALARTPYFARAGAKVAAAGNLSHEHLLLRVEPSMSVVPDDLASADTAFWRPRAAK